MPTSALIAALDQEIQDQVTLLFQLDQQIGELRRARKLLAGGEEDPTARPKPIAAIAIPDQVARAPKPKPKTRNLSPASRKKIAAAQKLRWRNWKRDQRARQKKEKVS